MDSSAFSSLTRDQQVAVVQQMMRRVERARQDPAAFTELVFATEKQEPVVLEPHQQLVLRFVDRHRMCVVRMPVGASKTFLLTAYGLYLLGRDVTSRGAIVSATDEQAAKPLDLMQQYILSKRQLELVFPNLRKSPDPHMPWSKQQFTVQRPPGIRDPSMKAVGLSGKRILGSRLSWVLADDILNHENVATRDARDKTTNLFNSNVMGRLDTAGQRCVVTNTPWDRDDITYRLERLGWPSITMSVTGDITFGGRLTEVDILRDFGDLVRPSKMRAGKWRLTGHDPDPDEQVMLWPYKYPREWFEWARFNWTPHEFARQFLCEPMSADAARCQQEWIDASFARGAAETAFPVARQLGWYYFSGVDIGGVKKTNDLSSICTIGLAPDGMRKIVNLQSGRWHGGELIARIIAEAARFDSDLYIESNAAQKYIHDFAQDKADTQARTRALRLHPLNTTGRNKHDAEFGVEAVFTEMLRNRWTWPAPRGIVPPELKELSDECLFYNPEQHTGDRLMALFLARQGLARPGRGEGAGRGKPRNSAAAGGGY